MWPRTVPAASFLVSLATVTCISRSMWLALVWRDWGVFTLPWAIIVVFVDALYLLLFFSAQKTLCQTLLLRGAHLCALFRLTTALQDIQDHGAAAFI